LEGSPSFTFLKEDSMAITKTNFASREEWLAFRKSGIGASDAPTMFGKNPYQVIEGLYLDKTATEAPTEKKSAHMDAGNRLEPEILKWLETKIGRQVVVEKDCVMQNSDYPHCYASLDGEIWEDGKLYEIAEAKTVFKAEVWESDTVPEHFYWQVQQQLAICQPSNKKGWLVMFHPVKKQYKVFEVEQCPEDWVKLYTEISNFWLNHVVPRLPPGSLANQDEISSMVDKLADLSKAKKEIEKEYKEVENVVKTYMASQKVSKLVTATHSVTVSSSSRSTFQTELFKTDYPDLYTKYVKKTHIDSYKVV
jgi:putative phage-type endonuclease